VVEELRGDKSLSQALRDSGAEVTAAAQLNTASQAQRDSMLRALEQVPLAERDAAAAKAQALVREQNQSLLAVASSLQLREVEMRLRSEERASGGGAAHARSLVTPAANAASAAAIESLNRTNASMRELVSKCQVAGGGSPHAAVTSSNAAFSVRPEGHITAYARPGGAGDFRVTLPGGAQVTVGFRSKESGETHWHWQAQRGAGADRVHPAKGANSTHFLLNLQTPLPANSTVVQEKLTSKEASGGKAAGSVEVPLPQVKAGVNAEYERSGQSEREIARTETVNRAESAAPASIEFEVKFNPSPIEILRGKDR
jgi:hypothetical protein